MKKMILFLMLNLAMASCGNMKKAQVAKSSTDESLFTNAVFITEKTEIAGVPAEYDWLKVHYPGYSTLGQSLVFHNSKPYDIIDIKTSNGVKKSVYFDISNYYGK